MSPGWRILLVVLALMIFAAAPAAQCPKLLMFGGTNFRTQTDARDAAYWGNTVGVQGFFLNYVMSSWQADVGTNSGSSLWQQIRLFQSIYSNYGTSDNFIKVALYKPHDWRSQRQNEAVVKHFAHAAMLARYADLKGVALDLEPYAPTWDGGDNLTATVRDEGRNIGEAMHAAYPDMTLIVLPDVLHAVDRDQTLKQTLKAELLQLTSDKSGMPRHEKYQLAVPFVRGLLSVRWRHVAVASESTYSLNGDGIASSISNARENYLALIQKNGLIQSDISVAPGLWPLGRSSREKSARENPQRFENRLQAAFNVAMRYVWIYDTGSAWENDGFYGKGPVVADFGTYLNAIHQVQANCRGAEAARYRPTANMVSVR
jgi:hypothetical protein